MSAVDVKRISQFITGEVDPFAIDVNTLFFLLVLTNQHISLMDKLECK